MAARPLHWRDHYPLKMGFAAGDTVEQLACWYGLSVDQVLSVVAPGRAPEPAPTDQSRRTVDRCLIMELWLDKTQSLNPPAVAKVAGCSPYFVYDVIRKLEPGHEPKKHYRRGAPGQE